MRRDPTEFRARFNAYKNGKMPYDAGRPVAIQEVDKSDADFAKRLRSNWRQEIWDWEGSGKAVTHKIGSSDNIVYPNVQTTEGGGLIDFTNPIWKGVVDPLQRAIQNKDFVPMKTESDAIWFGPNYKKYYPGFKTGKLPKFAEGTGGVENNITEEYAPIVSDTYQSTVNKLKQQTAAFNVDDYTYVAKKQHPEITREQVLAAYNNTPYVASDSSVGNTYGLYRHGEDDGYGRGIVIYPRRMRPDGPDFNLEDRIKSNMFHENHHGLRDMLFGGEYTDEERRYLELLAPGSKDYNEIGARVRQARGNMNIEMGRTGKKLDDDVDKMSQRDSKFHYTKVMKSMGITDWNPEIDKAFRWALKNVASTQIKPRQGTAFA